MLSAISRYGARVLPQTEDIVAGCKARGELIQGPQIREFEAAFARRAGMDAACAVTASYGRMAFYYILKALDLPAGSEIVVPALTFWVIPALARVAGLKVVFADIDPETFTLSPAALERAIGCRHLELLAGKQHEDTTRGVAADALDIMLLDGKAQHIRVKFR